jgi:hypothetical protein
MKRRNREEAAEYLTERSGVLFTATALAARATKGRGPRFAIFNGRALYTQEALDAWLTAELSTESPSAKRGRRPLTQLAA